MRRDIRPILATVDVGAHSIRQSIESMIGRDLLTEERSQQNEPGLVVVGGNGNVPACQVAPRTETSLLPSNTFEQTDQQPVQDDANVESPLLQQRLPLIHISDPTRLLSIPYAASCLKKKKQSSHDTTD